MISSVAELGKIILSDERVRLPNDLLQALGLIDVAFSFSLFPRECYLCDWLKNACCLLIADDNKSRTREEHCVTTQKAAAQDINGS